MQKITGAIILILFFGNTSFGQNKSESTEQLMKEAQQLAFGNHWEEARVAARLILKNHPNYHDARVLIGRTWAWQHQYDSARFEINKVLASDSSYRDAMDAAIDIEFWSDNLLIADNNCDKALKLYPDDNEFLIKKAKILMAIGNQNEAKSILSKLLNSNPNSYAVSAMLNNLKKYKSQVNIDHTFDFFKVPYLWRWHLTSIQYQLNTKSGVFIAKFNVGQLVNNGEHYLSNPNEQLEIEAYPIINKTTYIYADYGYSWCSFYPLHRIGLEPFKTFQYSWEVSAGFRFLVINEAPAYSYIPILTCSIGKYFADNWISFRPYVTISHDNGNSVASYLFYRHYFGIADNYIGGMAGYGISPDERYNYSGQFEHFNSSSYHLRLDIQHPISKRILFRFLSEFIYEAYSSSLYHYRYVNELYLSFAF